MKKVLLFTLEFPPQIGGVSKYYDNLVRYWGDANLFVLANKENSNINNSEKIFYQKLVAKYLWPRWLFAIYYLWQVLREKKIDHVIVGQILPLGTVTYFLSKFLKFKYSVILHGMDFSLAIASPRKKIATQKILSQASNIICGNTFTGNLLLEFEDKLESKLTIVNPGAEVALAVDETRVLKLKEKYQLGDKRVIFSIGRLVKRKGFDKVIEAMPEILSKIDNAVYVLAGAGPDQDYLSNKIKSLPEKYQKNVIMLGSVSDNDYWSWLNLCDVFAMPSRNINGDFEGFGIVFLEANLLGKPVVAGDSGGIRDAVVNGLNGLVVDPEDTGKISRAILKLLGDDKLRLGLGEQGRVRALQDFSWQQQINKIYKVIGE